ncbi:DUF7284 family protein [Salinirubrum litoreum]|uniref:Uncharacterized protein n=1 Tax=Salinirubrum litoreum TaxID=1126234 RepID=A0ABD5RAQ7_9EURY|nr:hypothetical protein [Salinirubrum litoreum]
MTSTVLDAAVCLLLVSAGAVTLVTVPDAGGVAPEAGAGGDAVVGGVADADDPDRADALATTLTTATASVNYTLAPGARRANGTRVAFPHTDGPQFERTSRGTLAGLLVDATLAGIRVEGSRLDHTGDDFRRGVRARTLEAVGANTQVVAVWRPTAEGPVDGRVVVGPDPPADRSVHAAVVRAPTGFAGGHDSAWTTADGARPAEQATDETRAPDPAAGEERERLARRVAGAVVTGLLPPSETRFALHGDYPVSALTRHRYLRLAHLFGVDLDGSIAEDPAETNVTRATRLLTAGLADSLSQSFRQSASSPGVDGPEITVGRVRITVRTWGAS